MLIKDDAPKPTVVGVRVWPRAIPQFNVGHLDALETAEGALREAKWDRFFLSGNYVSGGCACARGGGQLPRVAPVPWGPRLTPELTPGPSLPRSCPRSLARFP